MVVMAPVTLRYKPAAIDLLEQLERTDPRALDRIEDCLDTLEADPTSSVVRTHRIRTQDGSVWAVPVPGTPYAIFWEHQMIDTDVTVYAILVWSPSSR